MLYYSDRKDDNNDDNEQLYQVYINREKQKIIYTELFKKNIDGPNKNKYWQNVINIIECKLFSEVLIAYKGLDNKKEVIKLFVFLLYINNGVCKE